MRRTYVCLNSQTEIIAKNNWGIKPKKNYHRTSNTGGPPSRWRSKIQTKKERGPFSTDGRGGKGAGVSNQSATCRSWRMNGTKFPTSFVRYIVGITIFGIFVSRTSNKYTYLILLPTHHKCIILWSHSTVIIFYYTHTQ